MTTHVRAWTAVSAVLAATGASWPALADPAPPVALFVDLASGHVPGDVAAGTQKRIDLRGFPVLISTGPTTAVGVAGNYRLELSRNISIDSHGSISRTRVDSFAALAHPGTERGNGQAALHYAHDWFDLTLTPGAAVEGPERGMVSATTFDNALTLHGPTGWDMVAGSHAGLRSAPMEDGSSGADGAYNFGVAHRLASGSSFAANYSYGWSSPESAAASYGRQVALSADLAFVADLNCRAEYRQVLAADAPQILSLDVGWDMQSSGFGATSLTANLNLQRNDPVGNPGALGGGANVGLAMKF